MVFLSELLLTCLLNSIVDEGPPDADAFLDPVDIIKLFPGNFLDVICSPKWKDKNDLLEECLKIMEVPTNAKLIDNPDLRTYVDALGKRMTDTNVNVVANAAKVIQGLATGVMDQGFGKYRGLVMLPMLERLKEKKKNVTEAIGNALDAVFKTVSWLQSPFLTILFNSFLWLLRFQSKILLRTALQHVAIRILRSKKEVFLSSFVV